MTSRAFFAAILTVFLSGNIRAQQTVNQKEKQLVTYQDSLINLGFNLINKPQESERYAASYNMIKTLTSALKVPGSFNFGFDSLKTISIQLSPDKRFRIFSWHVMNNDGSYRFFGTVQMNTQNGPLKMFPLIDHSQTIKNPGDTVLSNDSWYGCQYYRVIPVTNARIPYYILLGWKGNTARSTKKIIEVLYFKDGKPYFGLPVFEGNKDLASKNRIIFEYSRQVSMLLNYILEERTIVFDHLAAPDPKMKDNPEMFGPDMSYDGLKLLNGKWKLIQDMELKNSPSDKDNLFNDPTKERKEPAARL